MRTEGKETTILNNMLKLKCLPLHQHELNALVELCFKIAVRFVKLRGTKIIKFRSDNDLSYEDIAVDAISHLFIPDETGGFSTINKYFLDWKPEISSSVDLLHFLQHLISRGVEYHLYTIYKENDLFFAKILDSFMYKAKKSGLKRKLFMGEAYLVEAGNDDFAPPFVTEEAVHDMPAKMFTDLRFDLIFQHFSRLGCARAIPINKFVYRAKHIAFNNFETGSGGGSFIDELEIMSAVDKAFAELNDTVLKNYLKSGKLTASDAGAISKALFDISADLKNGGIVPGLFDYLLPHMPGLSREEFKLKYHNILEYLIKSLKKSIIKKLK